MLSLNPTARLLPFLRISNPVAGLVSIVIGQKMLLLFFLVFGPALFPWLFPSDGSVRRFTRLDSGYYCEIADYGYTRTGADCAFYPLWPFCIRVGTLLGGSSVFWGYLLSNIFSLIGLLLFHRHVWRHFDLAIANRAAVLLLMYPGSIFFFFPYSESMFLLLMMLFMTSLDRENYLRAAAASFCLPMIRPIGIFVLPMLICELVQRRSPKKYYAMCLAPVAGYGVYFFVMYWATGNAFQGFAAQAQFAAKPSIARIGDVAGFIRRFAEMQPVHDMLHSPIDRALFLVFLASLFFIFRIRLSYGVYSLFAGVIPALSSVLMSYTRFLSVVFPFFILMAQKLSLRWILGVILILCGTGQVILLLRHISGLWAS